MQPPTRINPQVSVAGQIDRTDVASLAAEGYRTIINNRPDGEEPGQLTAAEAKAEAEARGLRYVYIPVTSATIDRAAVKAFADAIAAGPQPVLAHCRSGTRCYFLWGAAQALAGAPMQDLIAEAMAKGYDLRSLPGLVAKLQHEAP